MSNYFEKRLGSWAQPAEAFQLPQDLRSATATKAGDYRYFFEDEKGNISIRYFTLQGGPVTFTKSGNVRPEVFIRTRLSPSNQGDLPKYLSPKGSGLHCFFPPNVIEAAQKQTPIKKLIVIEGEFKAWSLYKQGVYAVGIPSIHGFYGARKNRQIISLNEDLIDLLKLAKVQRLIYLTDADTLSLNWEEGKEMTKRPLSFLSAVKNFMTVATRYVAEPNFELQKVYFKSIKPELAQHGKGIDDLLNFYQQPEQQQAVIDDLLRLTGQNPTFDQLDLTKNDVNPLYRFFGLKGVAEFYAKYREFLQDNEFIYKNAKYVYDENEGGPRFLHHQDVNKFLRVGPDWMKVIEQPNKYGEPEQSIIKWNIGEIDRDYKAFPGFVQKIPRYDSFCNEPNWTPDYQRVHYDCFNLSNPLPHEPKPGSFKTIAEFLKHLFRGQGTLEIWDDSHDFGELINDKENGVVESVYCNNRVKETAHLGDVFTVALDWLTISFRHPKKPLPVPMLVSKQKNTGKSTFLKFLQALYGSNNVAILNNDQFKMKFNSHYITKFIIAIDESFLDIEKKAEKERLKQLVTSDTAYLENKGMDLKKFPYYGKVIMASNDADSIMKMDDDDDRWFVVKVNPIDPEHKDPHLEEKMKKEIPAFLNFLSQRVIAHKEQDRLWFKPEYFITDQFREIVANTKDRLQKLIEGFLEDQFLTFELVQLQYDICSLTDELNKISKYRIDYQDVKRKLKEVWGLKPDSKPRYIQMPTNFYEPMQNQKPGINYTTKTARPITFFIEDWVSPEKWDEMKKDEGIIRLLKERDNEAQEKAQTGAQNDDENLPFGNLGEYEEAM